MPHPHQSVLGPLLRVPLFAKLKPLQITELARQAERIKFRAGAVITKAGVPVDGAFLIVSGTAEQKAPGVLSAPERVEQGALVVELAMFVEYVPSTTVIASERVLCLKLTRASMHEQMSADPALARHFENILVERLKRTAADLRAVDQRLVGGEPRAQPEAEGGGADNEKRPTPGEGWAQEARHAHSARREAGT
jgi:signal-transduction protein with cAMP-binding, CBS, and nucleotidyltransferase domain